MSVPWNLKGKERDGKGGANHQVAVNEMGKKNSGKILLNQFEGS